MATTTVLANSTTTDLDNTDSSFYLPRQPDSIFVGLKCREYPDMPLIYGFLHKQMGIKLRKHIAKIYPDEQTHYKNYIKIYNYDEDYIETKYYLPNHKWGRINPKRSLSLSLFHRPSRHSFALKNYLDFDIINAQLQVLLELAKIDKLDLTGGLQEYCENPKKCRYAIAEYYKLKDKITKEGYYLTAYEQAKKLPIRLAFGGGIYTWKKEFVSIRIADMPLIDNLMADLVLLRNRIVKVNPHIRTDLANEKSEDWNTKTEIEKDRSVMAFFAQTWERIIQEYCIADLVRTYNLSLGDIIPSQDGFMPLKKIINDKNIVINDLFDRFNRIILKKFGIDIKWSEKAFDEAFPIVPSDIIPIYLTLDDLRLGEAKVAETIYPAFKKKLIYSNKTNLWYYTDKQNIWCKTKYANDFLVAKTIQYYIKPIIEELWKLYREAEGDEKIKKFKKDIDEANKLYNSVGKSSYVGQFVKYLRTLLTDNNFECKLDNTGGKIVFADGIFDLKTAEFRRGIYKEDYVSYTLSVNYPTDFGTQKMNNLKTILKKILNWNDEHLEYYLSVLGYAFTGDAHLEKSIYYIVDGTGGRGDNGKTFFLDVLTHLFPEYVKQADPRLLEASNTKSHKQLPELNGSRIAWLDEGTKNKVNATLIKKIGDGMRINTDIMYGNTVDLVVSYKMFVCSNHIPKIDKDEEAVYNRYKQIQFCSHFDRTGSVEEENYETLDFIADTKLGDELKANYCDEIMSLLLEYGMKYYEKGLPSIPQKFIEAVNKTKKENNEFAKWFYKNYKATKVGHNISIDEIESISSYGRDDIIKELKGIGIKWNKNLKEFDVKTKIVKGEEIAIRGGISGYCRRVAGDDDDDDDA